MASKSSTDIGQSKQWSCAEKMKCSNFSNESSLNGREHSKERCFISLERSKRQKKSNGQQFDEKRISKFGEPSCHKRTYIDVEELELDEEETNKKDFKEKKHSDELQLAAPERHKNGRRKKMKTRQCEAKRENLIRQNSRSRRLVANARERSRIHILSDAFENLRRAVPSYSQDQKLSKLAILKLATYYISALANLAESDTSARSLKQFADCVEHCTMALQTEGRTRRKQFE